MVKKPLSEMPAYMLLRKSQSDKEEERRARAIGRDYDALANQRAALLGLAERDGVRIEPDRIYTEIKSGERLEARGEFQRLLAALREQPPGMLLYVVNTARVSRGLLTERGMLQDLFISQQVLVRTMAGVTDLAVADERLLYEFQGALAHHYLLRYKEDVARTRAVQLQQGRVRNGSVPYGYTWNKDLKQPQPHPTRFPVLQAMCRDAFVLSDRRLGQKYQVPITTIQTALRSPMIAGWPAQTTGYRPGTKRVIYLPREQWVMPEQAGTYETAMTWEDWLRLQDVRSARRKGRGGHTLQPDGWCRDVVQFAAAPGPVRLGSYNNGYGRQYPTYERPTTGPPILYVARAAVHEAVREALRGWMAHQASALLPALLAALKQAHEPVDASSLEAKRDKARRHLAAVVRELTDPELGAESATALRELRSSLELDIQSLTRQATALRGAVPRLTQSEAERAAHLARRLVTEYDRLFEELPERDRQLMVRLFVAEARVTIAPQPGSRAYRREVVVRLWEP